LSLRMRLPSAGFSRCGINQLIMKSLVTIILPVYNGANYLRQAIDSALAQTYDNCEVIVINDGSADNGLTETIAQSYGDRIKYIHKTNGGVATALNVGIRAARGDYISWLSHDDLYHVNKIERQMAFISSMPATNIVVYSDYEVVDANNEFVRTIQLATSEAANPRQAILLLLFKSTVHGCSLLLPKKCFTEVGYFAENLRTTQDYDLWFKLLKNGYEFMHMPEVLISSRWHEEQGTRSLYRIAHREIEALYVSAIDLFYDDIARFPVSTLVELIVDFRCRMLRKTPNHLLRLLKVRNREIYQQLYERYADQLSKSRRDMIKIRVLEITNAIIRRLGLRGSA